MLADVCGEALLLQLPVLRPVLPVEVGPGHVGDGGLLARLHLAVTRVQRRALAAVHAVLGEEIKHCEGLTPSPARLYRLIVQAELLEALRARGVGAGAAHHAHDQPGNGCSQVYMNSNICEQNQLEKLEDAKA